VTMVARSASRAAALSLTPALCATLLKPVTPVKATPARACSAGSTAASISCGSLLRHGGLVAEAHRALDAGVCGAAGRPGLGVLRLPGASSLSTTRFYHHRRADALDSSFNRTEAAIEKVEKYLAQRAASKMSPSSTGFSFLGQGINTAQAFITLKDWSERPQKDSAAPSSRYQQGPVLDPRCQDCRAAAAADRQSRKLLRFSFRLQDRGQKGYRRWSAPPTS